MKNNYQKKIVTQHQLLIHGRILDLSNIYDGAFGSKGD